jgi:hypothetical protein
MYDVLYYLVYNMSQVEVCIDVLTKFMFEKMHKTGPVITLQYETKTTPFLTSVWLPILSESESSTSSPRRSKEHDIVRRL